MGDGVIGSPQAFGALQSRFESESPSINRLDQPRFLFVPRKLERASSRDRLGRPVYQPDRVLGEDAA
jgi:hypothetical protein